MRKPTLLCKRKAEPESPISKAIKGPPESLARGMYPKGIARYLGIPIDSAFKRGSTGTSLTKPNLHAFKAARGAGKNKPL